MQLLDISHDQKSHYPLTKNEQAVFFMINRSGDITFELTEPGATAHVFAFFLGKEEGGHRLCLTQKHLAPATTSSALVKSVLTDHATLNYRGLIHIAEAAPQTKASQEIRSLLLSPAAKAEVEPALEILADDVQCHHAATAGALPDAALFYAMSRGLDLESAMQLLVSGFFHEAIEKIEALGINDHQFQMLKNKLQNK